MNEYTQAAMRRAKAVADEFTITDQAELAALHLIAQRPGITADQVCLTLSRRRLGRLSVPRVAEAVAVLAGCGAIRATGDQAEPVHGHDRLTLIGSAR